jgi:hypothetical protein
MVLNKIQLWSVIGGQEDDFLFEMLRPESLGEES